MENKKPFELRQIMAFYNFSVVGLSLYMTYEVSTNLFVMHLYMLYVQLLTFNKFINIIAALPFSKKYYSGCCNYIPPSSMLN